MSAVRRSTTVVTLSHRDPDRDHDPDHDHDHDHDRDRDRDRDPDRDPDHDRDRARSYPVLATAPVISALPAARRFR
jgi:ABC-type Zn2+ transport system substrate-binding protein/surface adhesin